MSVDKHAAHFLQQMPVGVHHDYNCLCLLSHMLAPCLSFYCLYCSECQFPSWVSPQSWGGLKSKMSLGAEMQRLFTHLCHALYCHILCSSCVIVIGGLNSVSHCYKFAIV